jgi:hypothetical protein
MEGPNLTLSTVTKSASDFLKQYHPSLTPPIPIEEIIEIKNPARYLDLYIFHSGTGG